PDPGMTFLGWSGDASGSTSPLPLTMDANKVVTATFTWKLTVATVGLGSINVAPNQASYNPGTPVTLTATPQTHVHFAGWSGDTTTAANPLSLTMTRNWNLTGTFALDAYALNVA